MKKTILLAISFALAIGHIFAQQPSNPEKVDVEDKSIVFPESMTENISKLLHDWQIDLTKSEADCNRGQNVVFNDSVYSNKLQAMPSVMELSFNQVVKSYIEMYANRRRDQVSYMLTLGSYYFPMFEEILDKQGLPLELKYLPVIESALNPVAVSRAGATGLWQFMMRTAQGYGLEVNSLVDERRDPYKSTEAAVRYLSDLYTIYGDWNLVIAAYNCGPGNVNKAIARSGGKNDYWEIYYHLPRETRGYVPAFIAANYIMNHYSDHNICPMESFGSLTGLDTVYVYNEIHFDQISQVLEISSDELKRLNPQFKKEIIPGNSKPYALVLPTNKMLAFIDQQDSIANYRRNTYFANRTNTDSYLNESTVLSGKETQNVYYRVKRGDNLSSIASRNGVTVNQIKSWNGLRSTKISVGKQLIVKKRVVAPPKTEPEEPLLVQADTAIGVDSTDTVAMAMTATQPQPAKQEVTYKTENKYYKVKKGDTLGAIARKNRVSVSQLQSWNGLKSTNITAGKSLIVNKVKVAVATPVESEEQQYNRADPSQKGNNIISDYLKAQIKTTEEGEVQEEAGNTSVETEETE